jgi:hypothetical protein
MWIQWSSAGLVSKLKTLLLNDPDALMDANPGMPVEEIMNIMDSFVMYTSNSQAAVPEQSEFCVSQGHSSFSETGTILILQHQPRLLH